MDAPSVREGFSAGESPSWLRHRILIPAFEGSNPSSPANSQVESDTMAFDNLMLFSGNANPRLAQRVAKNLNIQLGRSTVSRFSDGEVMVELLENVRGKHVFVLQSTCAPTNDHLMTLMILCDPLRRSRDARI